MMKTILINVCEIDGSIGCEENDIPEGYQVVVRYWPYTKMMDQDTWDNCEVDKGGEPYMDNIFGHVKTTEAS